MAKIKMTKGQTMIYKTLHRKLKLRKMKTNKNGDELRCSGRINSSCSRCGTCLVTICPYYSELCIQKLMQLKNVLNI